MTFRLSAIKIISEEVTDYNDVEEEAIIIVSFNVDQQFNTVKEFPNLFPKTIPTKVSIYREVNPSIDP